MNINPYLRSQLPRDDNIVAKGGRNTTQWRLVAGVIDDPFVAAHKQMDLIKNIIFRDPSAVRLTQVWSGFNLATLK